MSIHVFSLHIDSENSGFWSSQAKWTPPLEKLAITWLHFVWQSIPISKSSCCLLFVYWGLRVHQLPRVHEKITLTCACWQGRGGGVNTHLHFFATLSAIKFTPFLKIVSPGHLQSGHQVRSTDSHLLKNLWCYRSYSSWAINIKVWG